MSPILALTALALAAPRTPYGGELLAYVWGRPLSTHPSRLATVADASVQRAIYDRLYRLDGDEVIPSLARAMPEVRGTEVRIPLRSELVAHDGYPLTPAQIAEWLDGLVAYDSRASFVMLFVKGARARLSGSNVPVEVSADGDSLVLDLEVVHPELARLLASEHAGIGGGRSRGSGPFSPRELPKGGFELVPFPRHIVGRPFVDRVELRPLASRFGATSIAKDQLVFGVPAKKGAAWQEVPTRPEVLVLSVGDRIKKDMLGALDHALNRRRLSRRYLGKSARPTRTFVDVPHEKSPGGAPTERMDAKLLVAREARAGQRFAERVQLDLLRAGVSAVIERLPAAELEQRRLARDYELMLDVIIPDAPVSKRPIDQLHALLSIAASYGRPDYASSADLRRFFAAEKKEEQLVELERRLREEVGLLPIAVRPPAQGLIDLADLVLAR